MRWKRYRLHVFGATVSIWTKTRNLLELLRWVACVAIARPRMQRRFEILECPEVVCIAVFFFLFFFGSECTSIMALSVGAMRLLTALALSSLLTTLN